MKTNHKYLALALVAVVVASGLSLGSRSFAQNVTQVACSPSAVSANANQSVTFSATGGDGTNYVWSGTNLSVNNSAGNMFAVSYPTAGTYTLSVVSATSSANCTLTVVNASGSSLMCSPATQSVVLGQSVSVSASGGNGSYTWSSPELTIANNTGSGFSASFASVGAKNITVSSGGVNANCVVNVLPNGSVVTPPVTPGLPNTGGGYGH